MSSHLIAKPILATDVVLFGYNDYENDEEPHVLLIQRKYPPFQDHWALPGGHVDENEFLEVAAVRELREETGIDLDQLIQVKTFGDPGRDPRGWTISVAFMEVVAPMPIPTAGDDAKSAKWFRVSNLPPLAFDHRDIIKAAIDKERKHMIIELMSSVLEDKDALDYFIQEMTSRAAAANARISDEQDESEYVATGHNVD